MVDEARSCRSVSGDDVEHTRRNPGIERQVAEPQGAQGRLLGGLEHDGASCSERWRELPHGHQERKVPWDDLAADPDRLPARVAQHLPLGHWDDITADPLRPAVEMAQLGDG